VPLEGNWSGSGTVQQTEGAPEKVSCRINYKRETDKVFRVAAKCATTAHQINQSGQLLMVGPGVYVGEFQIPSYDIAGRIRVVVEGSAQTMTFKSSRAQGSLTLTKS
jgi:hypothetical protein